VLAGHLALALAAVFAGAAFYVNFAEHPARFGLDDKSLLNDAGYTMQGALAVVSGILALAAWWATFEALIRGTQAAQKLAPFEKLKAAGGFAKENPSEIARRCSGRYEGFPKLSHS
jgi:hypothetical protein